jgi:hypothetical protein
MIQQYQPTKFTGTAGEKRSLMVEVAHMLNRLRDVAEENGTPLTGREEEAFWKFISTLPADAQSSVIN